MSRRVLTRVLTLLVALTIAPSISFGQGKPGSDDPAVGTAPPADTTPAAPASPEAAGATADEDDSAAGATTADADPATPIEPTFVSVDSAGGPLTLPEDVAAAIEAWRTAAPDLVALEVAGSVAAGDRVVYADPDLLGPDTLSLGVRYQGRPGIELRVAPQAPRDHPWVLLHEIGVLLGLPEGGEGVMAFSGTDQAALTAPTPADVSALRDLRRYRPEDLTRDGVVDFNDLVAFGQAYGAQGLNLPADLDGDGSVGLSDLELLRDAYSFTVPAELESPTGAPSEQDPAAPEPTEEPLEPPSTDTPSTDQPSTSEPPASDTPTDEPPSNEPPADQAPSDGGSP